MPMMGLTIEPCGSVGVVDSKENKRAFGASIGNESVPIQLAQCWLPKMAISNAKIYIYFSSKIPGSNYIKRHLETVIVWNYQNDDCS